MNFQLRPWLSLLQRPHSPSDFPETRKEALSTPLARAPHKLADQGTQESTVLDGGPALCCLLGQRPSSYSVRTIPQGSCPPARPPQTVCPGRTQRRLRQRWTQAHLVCWPTEAEQKGDAAETVDSTGSRSNLASSNPPSSDPVSTLTCLSLRSPYLLSWPKASSCDQVAPEGPQKTLWDPGARESALEARGGGCSWALSTGGR